MESETQHIVPHGFIMLPVEDDTDDPRQYLTPYRRVRRAGDPEGRKRSDPEDEQRVEDEVEDRDKIAEAEGVEVEPEAMEIMDRIDLPEDTRSLS